MTKRIAMWSGPRNLSTAMMRSFGSRADTFVSDEPFYGCFLKDTGADHPMQDEVIAAMDCDWRSVMATLREPFREQSLPVALGVFVLPSMQNYETSARCGHQTNSSRAVPVSTR